MHVEMTHAVGVKWLAILVLLMIAGGLLATFLKSPRRVKQIVGFGLVAFLFLALLVTWSVHRSVERARVVARTRAVREQTRAVQQQAEALSDRQARDVLQAQEDAIEFYRLSQEQQAPQYYVERPPAAVALSATNAAKASAGWQSEADLGFQADVYPSLRSAAEALAEQVLREFPRLMTPGPGVERVELCGHEIEPDVLAAVQKRLQAHDVRVEIIQAVGWSDRGLMDERGSGEVIVMRQEGVVTARLDIPSSSTDRTDLGYDERSGTVRLQVLGNAVRFDRTARFVEKPWVADYSTFLSKVSLLQQVCIVGYSAPSGATRQEAEEAALQAAAIQLVPLVRDWAMRAPGVHPVSEASDAQLREWIAQQLRGGEGIQDRFVQSFNRPYGRVWREAVLVDSSSMRVAAYAGGCLSRLKYDWASRIHPVVQVAALAVLICIVYLFLNAVTKGYYTRTLMGTSVIALALGVLILLKLG